MRYSLLRTPLGPPSRPKKVLISPAVRPGWPEGSAVGLVRESQQERQKVLGEPVTLLVGRASHNRLRARSRITAGRIAQLGERQLDKLEVTGSSPVAPTAKTTSESPVNAGLFVLRKLSTVGRFVGTISEQLCRGSQSRLGSSVGGSVEGEQAVGVVLWLLAIVGAVIVEELLRRFAVPKISAWWETTAYNKIAPRIR